MDIQFENEIGKSKGDKVILFIISFFQYIYFKVCKRGRKFYKKFYRVRPPDSQPKFLAKITWKKLALCLLPFLLALPFAQFTAGFVFVIVYAVVICLWLLIVVFVYCLWFANKIFLDLWYLLKTIFK